MSHSTTTIWIYSHWSTWENTPLINSNNKNRIFNYLQMELISCGCTVRVINGMPDHVYCLFHLNPKKSLDEIIKMVKGATSHRINQEDLTPAKFAWQKGYSADSVSESQLEKIIREINFMK